MAQIDASGLLFSFSAALPVNVQHFAFANAGPDHYTWTTAASSYYRITALSSVNNITAAPLAGTIDSIEITDSGYTPGLSITGLNVGLASLIDTGNAATNFEKFWETSLAGATTVIMPTTGNTFTIMGDFATVNAGQTKVGAVDTFLGLAIPASHSAIGDALLVDAGAKLTGGNDVFTNIAGTLVAGDVANPETGGPNNFGTVIGGADKITLTDPQYFPSANLSAITGDVGTNGAGGLVTGGGDTIVVRNASALQTVAGDVLSNSGTTTGGSDTILLETTIRGRTFMSANTVVGDDTLDSASPHAFGGNDKVTLNNVNSSYVSGDFYQVDNSTAHGGNDTIRVAGTFALLTPAGSDPITPTGGYVLGDAYATNGTTSLTGGNDTISVINVTATNISGDVYTMNTTGNFTGGDDTIAVQLNRANASVTYAIGGDGLFTSANLFKGGNDVLTLNLLGSMPSSGNQLAGDAITYNSSGNGSFTGGNDRLTIAASFNQSAILFGDGNSASSSGNMTLIGGNDTLTGGGGNDRLVGDINVPTAGGTLTETGGKDVLDGRGGNDTIEGGLGSDTAVFGLNQSVHVDLNGIYGTSSSDLYEAVGQGNDQLVGIEHVTGSAQADIIVGNGAANVLRGMNGADKLSGNGGNDFFNGGVGKDAINGGSGLGDTADYSEKTQKVTVALTLGTSTDVKINNVNEDRIRNVENINGGSAGDALTGDTAGNQLSGNGGNDVLVGGGGSDTLIGGLGNDKLTGSAANDFFRFTKAPGAGNLDTITDFNHAQGDKIQLDNAVMTALGATTGPLGTQFYSAAGATNGHDGNDHVVYNTTTGALYYDSNGSAAGGFIQIAVVSGHPALAVGDFAIV